MAKYIIKRVAMGIFSIFIVATVTFFVMNLVPGGPFVAEKSISAAAQQALAEKYGLDKPLGAQYVNYMKSLLHGDLGLSLRQRGRTVNEIIASKLPVSCRLAGVAVLVALCIGIPLGCISAYNRGKWLDNIIIVFATCGIAIPSFISSVLLLYEFGMNLKLLPTVGLNSAAAYIMPVTALAIYPSAYITRLMRSSLLDVMGQDYMRTARAKGVSQFMILFKHALRNAILPVITYVGPMLASLMTGSFVVEKIFSVPGLGRDFVIVGDSIYFNQSNGANANLAALHYDAVNDHWSAPILLIGDEQYLENLNAAELNGKTYALGMHTTVTITADDVDDTKDLVWTQILPVSDLKLSDVSFDADALVPGETLPVTFTVTNSGDHTVSSLTLTANGVNTAQDCNLLPGESAEFTVNITCPSEKQIVTFEVQEPGQDDYTPEDNTAACTVGSADAEVELALLQIGSRKFLQAVVVNRGLEPASGSVLFTGPDGQTLAERTFQNLTYGGTVIAEYEPDSFAALYGEDVTATVRLHQDEPNMLNNTDSVPVLLTSTEILSAQRTGTAVTAEIACMQDGARAICAFYAADVRLLSTVIQPLESGKINSLTFQIDSNAAQAKLFVLDAKNAPAAAGKTVQLNG